MIKAKQSEKILVISIFTSVTFDSADTLVLALATRIRYQKPDTSTSRNMVNLIIVHS